MDQPSVVGEPAKSDGSWSKRFGGAALVTGAASGIGEAFCWALAARGMDLILVDIAHERALDLADAIEEKYKVRAVPVVADLSRPDCADVVRDGVEAAGLTVGLLVNNAGYGLFGPFTELNPADQAMMVDVNCRAPLTLSMMFAPGMKARGRGGMIFTASTAAYQPTPWMATYAATKSFDLFLAEALWAEMEEHGVEVLGLSPGHVRTRFQDRCGDPIHNPPGGVSTPEEIVATALAALGRKPSVIPGMRNIVMARLTRLMPRRSLMHGAIKYFDHLLVARPTASANAKAKPPLRRIGAFPSDGRFVTSVIRLLIAFFAVATIDVVVGSLITHKLRFWFPLWLDAHWDTNPQAWVTYSQSYFAGILFLPVLAAAAMRAFLPKSTVAARTTFIGGTIALLGFIAWWKGGLMMQYNKGQEALAWIALTAITWGLIRLGEELPSLTAGLSPARLATRMAQCLVVFFFVMAALDPLMTVGVQGLPWSSGLIIEMSFFIPAGLALMALLRSGRLQAVGARLAEPPEPKEGVAAELLQALKAPRSAEPDTASIPASGTVSNGNAAEGTNGNAAKGANGTAAKGANDNAAQHPPRDPSITSP